MMHIADLTVVMMDRLEGDVRERRFEAGSLMTKKKVER
jgi:hypothetical protein